MFNLFAKAKPEDAASTAQTLDAEASSHRVLRRSCPPIPGPVNAHEERLAQRVGTLVDDCENLIQSPQFDLPTLPSSALKLMDCLQDASASMKDIGGLVQHDPVLTAKFLRMANSSYYGGRVEITTVVQALNRLGLREIRNLVMSVALHSTVFKDKRLNAAAQGIFDHALGCAMVAQAFAARLDLAADRAFTAGLLHDIGKVPALLLVQQALERDATVRKEFVEGLVERHHVRTGLALLNTWQLPLEAHLTMSSHHAVNDWEGVKAQVHLRMPQAAQTDDYCNSLATVVLADRALSSLGFAEEPGEVDVLEYPLAQDLGLEPTEVTEFLGQLPALMDKMPKI